MKRFSFIAAFFVLLTITPGVPAQELRLGENAGTGDTKLRRAGSWDLVKIETTATGFGRPRGAKGVPLDTREKKGIMWGYGNRRIAADLVFKNLKETLTNSNLSASPDISLNVFVTAAVTGEGINSERNKGVIRSTPNVDFVRMKCAFDITQPSEGAYPLQTKYDEYHPYVAREIRIYTGSNYPGGKWFYEKGEFECGVDGRDRVVSVKPEEDFRLNYRLLATDAIYAGDGAKYDFDVTYHFFYKWKGWRNVGDVATPGSTGFPGGVGGGPFDKEWLYRWAQKQDASALESRLISNAARLFNSPSVAAENLSSAFADVSVIIADRTAKANFAADDKDAASPIWSTHKTWADRQGPKVSLDSLKQRLSAAFNYLSRSQKDLFFADVSVAMAKAEVAAPANQAAAEQGPFVKPKKDVFAVGEDIVLDYGYAKSTGWDWVVIAEPGNEKNAKGSHSGINDDFSKKLEPSDNSIKDRRGTINFPRLPEGKYVAKYISWPDGHAVLTATEITVGKASSPPPLGGSTSGNLTGLWRNPGSAGVYRVRQIASKLVWGLDAIAMGSYANMFQGQISGDNIDGVWEDLPGSPTIGGGRMLLKIESECRFVRVSSVNRYGADVWVKKDSICDVVGLTQRAGTGAVATKPGTTSTTNKPKPRVEEIPDEAAVATNKPKAKPKVEEIPDDEIRVNKSDDGVFVEEKPAKETTPAKTQPQPNPKSTPKPKSAGPSIWEKLGTAINQAVTQQPQQPTGGDEAQSRGCAAGSFSLGTPTPDIWTLNTPGAGVRVAWSAPQGFRGTFLRVFRAGTAQELTSGYLPESPGYCGLSYSIYPNSVGDFEIWMYRSAQETVAVAGPARFRVVK